MGQQHANDHAGAGTRLPHAQEALDLLGQIEGQFAQVKQGLESLQRLSTLGTLAATVAHEFNNILTPIVSYAQLALARPDDPELAMKAHQKALEGGQRASQLCSALLGYARDDDTGESADLSNVVHAAIDCLGNSLNANGIKLELDLPDTTLAIRPGALEQVLVNLLINARKAMTPAGGTLSIRATVEQHTVTLHVADTGRGVPPDIADHLFEPFVTLDPSQAASPQQGTGLGLSICRDLVTAAQGQITFTSTPGQGATFHITLPRVQSLRKSA